jgi:hypothetical protein
MGAWCNNRVAAPPRQPTLLPWPQLPPRGAAAAAAPPPSKRPCERR